MSMQSPTRCRLLGALLFLTGSPGLFAGCSKSWSAVGDPPSAPITADSRAEAAEIFIARCQNCHGAGGLGDGPAAVGLHPRPRNFTDKMWQSNVTDTHIERIIQFGGPSVGKSPAMAPNPDLISKPAVVAALRERVRKLGQGDSAAQPVATPKAGAVK
jgi:mono/diheme cytochrome c family protein